LSGYPISKFDLLSLVAKVYNKKIEITPDFAVKIDRSLNGEIFDKLTGYKKRKWEDLIFNMKISYDYFR
jgi:dTDP-4-dehydrorhamnose reductase